MIQYQHLFDQMYISNLPLGRVRVRHPGRVPAHDVEVCAGHHPRLGVPLDLGGARVEHGAGEDGEDGRLGVQDALLHDGLVLPHPHLNE